MFRFSAKDFDVITYLNKSSLNPIEIFKKGDYQQTALESWVTEFSGFCIAASEADFTDFKQQMLDTTAFIHANKQELLKLGQIPDRVSFFFDFGLTTTLFEEDIWVDSFAFPIEFMCLLCEIGANMKISYYYPSSDENADTADE